MYTQGYVYNLLMYVYNLRQKPFYNDLKLQETQK